MTESSVVTLLNENFRDFAIGEFPYDPAHSAMGEYHYYPDKEYRGNWYDPIAYHSWIGPTWVITEYDGIKYMEQTRVQAAMNKLWPMLVAGESGWKNYTVEATVRMLSTSSHTGILFRYQHSRCHYGLCFEGQKLHLIKRDQEEITDIATLDFAYNCDDYYRLKVECQGAHIKCFVDGKEYLSAEDETYQAGLVALASRMPAQFTDVTVTMSNTEYAEFCQQKKENEITLALARSQFPRAKLWKIINLQNFGAGRQVRFGHLLGTSEMQMVIAQHQKRVHKDSYANISCLTAVDLNGNILWQIGEPSTNLDNAYLTADLPFQVCDVDLDGFDEVVVARNFQLMILDGKTGQVKNSIATPYSEEPEDTLFMVPFQKYAFDRVNVDSIRIANFSGKTKPTDIIIKDRYSRVWVFDHQLNFIWKFQEGITGHFPYTADLDNDGRDEMFIGYHLVDHDGKLIWTLPVETDHTDEIIIGCLDPASEQKVIGIVSGDEGFMLADLQGNILKKHLLGHAQRISVGNYRPDLPGLEICVTTYWGYQGIIYLFDCKGNLLHQFEPSTNGNVITPINWTGDGQDLILLNGNPKFGGLINGYGQQVVTFPEDGHPDLCAEAVDLTGDNREEIVLWDEKRMYIYTQDNDLEGGRIYAPAKYPHYNASNYRGEFSYPHWKE